MSEISLDSVVDRKDKDIAKRILAIDFQTKNTFAHLKWEIHLLRMSVDLKFYFCDKMPNAEYSYPEI